MPLGYLHTAISSCLLAIASLTTLPAVASVGTGTTPLVQFPSQMVLDDERLLKLLDAIDFSRPELADAKSALERGDLPAVRSELAQYLRQRSFPTWHVDPRNLNRNPRYNREVADSAVEGRVQGGLVSLWKTFPGGDIDWLHNETIARAGAAYNNEWQWQLNRMHFWDEMAKAYAATGDERYPQAWVTQLRSFVFHCPVPAEVDNTPGSAWRTIECGIRMSNSWPSAFHRFLLSPSVSDDDLLLFMLSSLEHAQYLHSSAERSRMSNWRMMEMNGLYTIGAMFPEFKDSRMWRGEAIDTFYQEMTDQFLDDGFQIELTPGYHDISMRNLANAARLAKRVDRYDELPQDFVDRLKRGFDVFVSLMTPDRSLPMLNDSWPEDVPAQLARSREFFPEDEQFLWVVSDGAEGSKPEFTSYPFWNAGYFIMRSGWERDANYAVFDAGPLGQAHQHQDKLNLVVYPYGREVLFDGGGGSYEDTKWRWYAFDSYSHNTVIVDGMAQRRERIGGADTLAQRVSRSKLEDVIWESDDSADFAVGVYEDAYGKHARDRSHPARHTRRVLFSKPDVWVVADTLEPKDGQSHHYQARWHLMTTNRSHDERSGVVATTDEGLPNLAVIPLATNGLATDTVSGQEFPELLGWHIRKDMTPGYVPVTTVLHNREGAGVQRFVTLLVPVRAGEENPVLRIEARDANNWIIHLRDGTQYRLYVDPEAKGEIRLER